MKTRFSLLFAVALIGPMSAASAQAAPQPVPAASVSAPDPAFEIKRLAQLFRANDLAALAQAMVPPSKWQAARTKYAEKMRQPATESDRRHFAENVQELTAPDAVDRLMAKVEPELAKARPNLPGMQLMAFGALQVAANSPDSKLTPAQRDALRTALPGLQQWATSTDFLSSDLARRALTLVTDAARRTGITDIDQIKAMSLEDVLERVSPMLAAAKQAVQIYGIDLDAVADSLTIDVLDRGPDTARVRTTVTLFGARVSGEQELVLVEGHWYGKHVQHEFDEADEDEG